MVNLAVILGGKRDYASKQLKQSLLFEMRLAKVHTYIHILNLV